MSLRRRALAAAAIAATAITALAASATGSSVAHERATKSVLVGDDYFGPTSLKVKSGDKVKWKWVPTNLNTHDVVLTSKHPNGVKPADFKSVSGSIGIKFNRKFKVPGNYGFICTFHRSVMKLDLKVKR